jgi:hypothetical protein
MRLTRRFRGRLPRRLGESISVVAGPRNHDDEGLADAGTANPFRLPRLHPGMVGGPGAREALRVVAERGKLPRCEFSARFRSSGDIGWRGVQAVRVQPSRSGQEIVHGGSPHFGARAR